jgi:hypothetical protein
MYSARGRNAATAATTDHAIWSLWNPHSTQRIKLIAVSMFAQGGSPASGYSIRLRRITARGTAGSTVTPGISNHSTRGAAPPSGALLDLAAFSVQPTLEASSVDFGFGYTFANTQASGLVYPIPGGIEIPPGAGVACIQVPASASTTFEIAVTWLEDWM